jgi:hypothetical protein
MSGLGARGNFYGLIFILSVMGAILFIFTEFGGYTTLPYYYQYSVNLGSSFSNPDLLAYAPLFLLVAFFFLFNVFLSLKELKVIRTPFPGNSARLGMYSSLGILAITAIGGIAFASILSSSGASNWWFSSGFYAGIIGGILLPLLYYLVMKGPKEAPPPPPSASPQRFCAFCGSVLPPSSQFCPKCGKQQPA